MTSVGASDTGGQERPDPAVVMAELAEAALLGALMWDPRRLQDISWLDPSDFSRPSHQAIYQTLVGLVAGGKPIDLLSLPDVLHRGDYHELHSDNTAGNGPLSAYALSELLSMTPAKPGADSPSDEPAPSEHRRYGEIVLEASIRRQVLRAGISIEQTALDYSNLGVDAAFGAIDRILDATTTRLDELTHRLGESRQIASAIGAALTGSPPRGSISRLPTSSEIGAALDSGAVRATASPELSALSLELPVPSAATLRRAEYALIGACLTEPWLREIAHYRLRAEDFAEPEVAATWLALSNLTDSGEPVDFVLVGAEVQRHGEHPDYGHGIEPLQLATLSRRADVVSGSRAISEVIRAALSRAAAHAHNTIAEAGADRTQDSARLLAGARDAVQRIDAIRQRLDGQLRPPSRGTTTSPSPTTTGHVPGKPLVSPSKAAPRVFPRLQSAVPRQAGRSR
jgi:replicative DNA helicase